MKISQNLISFENTSNRNTAWRKKIRAGHEKKKNITTYFLFLHFLWKIKANN